MIKALALVISAHTPGLGNDRVTRRRLPVCDFSPVDTLTTAPGKQ